MIEAALIAIKDQKQKQLGLWATFFKYNCPSTVHELVTSRNYINEERVGKLSAMFSLYALVLWHEPVNELKIESWQSYELHEMWLLDVTINWVDKLDKFPVKEK